MPEKKKQTAKKSDKKLMDVARPGKTAPSASSRPVIIGHGPTVKDPMVSEDNKMPDTDAQEHKIEVKRTGPKVITPLSSPEGLNEEKSTGEATDKEPAAEPSEPVLPAEVTGYETPPSDTPAAESKPEASEDETVGEETPTEEPTGEERETEPEEKQVEEPEEDADEEPGRDSRDKKDSKGSSIVDAIAGQAAKDKDKKDDKKNEELAQRLAEIEKLVEDKKYFVHTSTTTKEERKTRWAVLLLSILLLVGAYLALDAQAIKNDYWLPYEFFEEQEKKKETTPVTPVTGTDQDKGEAEGEQPTESDEAKKEEGASAQARANDTERKNEMKALQQKLETYYNDNGTYPAELADLPTPLADEIAGPKGDAYVYTPGANNASYVLTAQLENKSDPDATNGVYTLRSLNQ